MNDMNKIERLQSYADKVITQEDNFIAQIVQKYEESLPEELQGLFTYDYYWSNGWSFIYNLTFENVKAKLEWDKLSEKYTVTFSHKHYPDRVVESHEDLAKELIKRLEK